MILARLELKPMSRMELLQLLEGVGEKRFKVIVASMIRRGDIFESDRIGRASLLGTKPFKSTESIVLDALKAKPQSALALAKRLERSHSNVCDMLSRMERRGVVRYALNANNVRVWHFREDPKRNQQIVVSAKERDDLVKLVRNQWRGTPWQGLECVL